MIIPLTRYADTRSLQNEMKVNGLTLEQVIAEMKRRQGGRHAKELAAELGVSATYISDVYRGRREPGESILQSLGLVKRVLYERVA